MDSPDGVPYAIIIDALAAKPDREAEKADDPIDEFERAGKNLRAFAPELDSAGQSPRRRRDRDRRACAPPPS